MASSGSTRRGTSVTSCRSGPITRSRFSGAADAVGHGRGVALEIYLPSCRVLELDLKTGDGQWATLQEFVAALEIARKLVVQPVEE
jgi:hypothetical protein